MSQTTFAFTNMADLLRVSVSVYVYGLVQDCSKSSANALELLQSCTKPSM